MEVGILSMRYAKAMIEYAQEKGVEDKLYQEFLTLSYCFCAQPGLREALDNPVISTKEKLALVCTAADGNGKSTREFVHFITLVLRNRREGYLQFISLMYLDLYRKLKHIGVGKLITAVPVDKETEDRIRSAAAHILHAQMELETVVDPSIEGSITVSSSIWACRICAAAERIRFSVSLSTGTAVISLPTPMCFSFR